MKDTALLRQLYAAAMALFIAAVAAAQTETPLSDLEKAFPMLKKPETLQGSQFVIDSKIQRKVASPEIEKKNTIAQGRLATARADLAIKDVIVKNERGVVEQRKKELNDAELVVQQWKAQVQTIPDKFPNVGIDQQQLDNAVQELAKAEKKRDAASAELQKRQAELSESQDKAAAARDEAASAESAQAAAAEEKKAWIEQTTKDNPAQGGALLQPDTIVIRFSNTATRDEIQKVFDDFHLTPRSGILSIRTFFVEQSHEGGPSTSDAAARLRKRIDDLRKVPKVLNAFPNVLLGKSAVPRPSKDVPQYAFQPGNVPTAPAILMRLPEAWNFAETIRRSGNTAVKVLVIDEGFNKHDDLVVASVCTDTPSDHGTHVLGIIGAKFDNESGIDGDTPFAQLIACAPNFPALPAAGNLTQLTMAKPVWFTSVTKSFDDQVSMQQPAVVNLSLGYNWGTNLGLTPDSDADVQDLVNNQGAVVRALIAQHSSVVVVSSAGNDCQVLPGCTASAKWTSPFNWAALADANELPASDNVFVVESVDAGGNASSFSNHNGTIAAPGDWVFSTVGTKDYDFMQGTSMAAPQVSAVVALMLAYNPSLTVSQIRTMLPIGTPRKVVDAFAALAKSKSFLQVAHDLADLNHDGVVDMADFTIFRKTLQDTEAGVLAPEPFSILDLNGDRVISRDKLSDVPGLGLVTDLGVMMVAWQDGTVPAAQLVDLLGPPPPAVPAVAAKP